MPRHGLLKWEEAALDEGNVCHDNFLQVHPGSRRAKCACSFVYDYFGSN